MFIGRSASVLMHPYHVLEELVCAKLFRLMRPAMALWRSSEVVEVKYSIQNFPYKKAVREWLR